MADPDDINTTLAEALKLAGDVVLPYFRRPLEVDVKDDDSPVTLADRAAEAAIRELLMARFPDHAIYGEEQGCRDGAGGTWVIDPIDGTKSFLLGNPLFGCLLAFVRNNRVEAGGLAMPALGETWLADRRSPTRLNGKPMQTSQCREVAAAALLTSSPDFFDRAETEAFDRIAQHVRYRRFGGDCYTYAMLAGGWCDLVIESSLYPFDYLALVPIVEQAGGVISDWRGRPLGLDSGPRVVAAATPELHREVLATLSEVGEHG